MKTLLNLRARSRTDAVGADVDTPVPLARPGRTASAILLLVLAGVVVQQLVVNEAFEWDVVGKYLFSDELLKGVRNTLVLTVAAMAIALVLAVALALMRESSSWVLSMCSRVYLWFFRGTPLLVQLVFWFNLGYLYQYLSLTIPFGPTIISVETNSVISVFGAALIGISLNEAAYAAEIVRGGLLSVPTGQREAARVLGLSSVQAYRRIILPQSMRFIVPPMGNELIAMLKYTSLASVIGYPELLQSASSIYNRTFQVVPLLVAVSLWYLFLTSVLMILQEGIERYYGRGFGELQMRRNRLVSSGIVPTSRTGPEGERDGTQR